MANYTQGYILGRLWKGESIARILMNIELSKWSVRGMVVDVGGGRNPNYYQYLTKASDTTVIPLDGTLSGIDFEKDPLPYETNSVDTVICCNVLEHMYNYRFLVGEMYRLLKPKSQLIGFVPFWMGYHPDPHDYFRYTDESLKKIFEEAGFRVVAISRVGAGPLIGNFNTIVLSVPRVVRPVLYCIYKILDTLFVKTRPKSLVRNPLGYVFVVEK